MHEEDARYSIQLLAHQIETDNHRTHKSSSEASVAVLKAGLSVITWEILKTHTSEDAVLVKVMEQVGKGFPDSSDHVSNLTTNTATSCQSLMVSYVSRPGWLSQRS